MKKQLLTAVLGICGLATIASAQSPKFNISVNPLGLAFGNGNVKGEYYGLYEGIAPAVEGNYWAISSGGSDYKAYGLGASVRKYSKKDFKRWFVQPGVEIGKLSVKTSFGDKGTSTYFGGYLLGGYRWMYGERVTIDLGLGVGLYSGSVTINGVEYSDFSGMFPKGLLSIGYNF